MNSPIPDKIGRFEITKVLGQGGMGVVYLGRDSGTEREVAVKTVKVDAPEDIKQRLRIEGKAGKLDHENIVTVYETGQWSGDVPYIAMQYVPGDSLDKLVSSRAQLTLLDKLDTIRQVCDGLDYAHLNGVVHRDIKPGNVIRRHDGLVKIVDFGIARVQTGRATTAMTGPLQVIGTLAYMAPERLRGERGDGRVDIFATGVLLYYVLTGEEPFTGEASAVMHKLVSEPHPPLSQRLAGYPTALDQILDRALAKYPEDRYSTAQEFSADLAAVIDELNRGRIAGLLEDCKRLIEEGTFRAAADKAQQILKIDPQNSAAREMRRSAQRGLDRKAIEERLRELQAEAAEAVAQKRYDDAIRALEEASRRAPGDPDLQDQLEGVREKRRIQLLKDSLCSEARTAQSSGDLTGAIQRLRKASEFDPDDVPLLEELSALERVAREQEERERTDRLISNAKKELGAQRYTDAIAILEDLLQSRVSHPDLDTLYRRALDGRKTQETERRRDHVVTQVRKLRIDGKYSDALSEIDHAPEELRSDTMLLRLKRELERDAENSRLAAWIAETVDHVLKEALTSLDAALVTLRGAMQKLPGEDRFESLEADLLHRKQEFSNQQRRAACLREAGEVLHNGEPERAIKLIEYYLLEFQTDAEIDGLLQDARQALEAQRLRIRLSEYTAQGRTLLDEGRFTQAIAFLRPLVEDTQNRALATLLGQAEQGKTEADGRIRLIAKRVAELRQEGKLAEAIALIESQPAGMLHSSLLQEVLPKLREEQERFREEQRREQEKLLEEQRRQQEEKKRNEEKQREEASRRQAFEGAVAKMRALVEDGDWQRAREPLENVQRIYGDSGALAQAMAAFDRDRTEAADRRINQSIQEAKAALVTADTKAARQALEQSTAFIPFASAKLVEEWRRLENLPKAKPVVPVSLPVMAGETEAPETRSKSKLWLGLGAAAFMLVGIGLFVAQPWKKPEPQKPDPTNIAAVGKAVPVAEGGDYAGGSSPDPKTSPTHEIPGFNPNPSKPSFNEKPKGPDTKPQPPTTNPKEPAPAGKQPNGTGTGSSTLPGPASPPVEITGSIHADKSRVEQGTEMTISWQSNSTSPVTIDGIEGELSSSGQRQVRPDKDMLFRLRAGGRLLDAFSVSVVPRTIVASQPPDSFPPKVPLKNDPPPAFSNPPDKAALTKALGALQGVFGRASTGKAKECKSALAGLSQFGSTKPSSDLQNWCEASAKFQASPKCDGSPSGNDKEATWTCAEVITISPKDSAVTSAIYHGDAHFTKAGDAWQVTKWDLRP